MAAAKRHKVGEWVSYRAYGVGRIRSLETVTVGGDQMDCYVVEFQSPRLLVRVPVEKAEHNGLRGMGRGGDVEKALDIIRQPSRKHRVMWNKRVAVYEQKVRAGDMISLAEVLRDLKDVMRMTEPSYSERLIFEDAFKRFSREISITQKITLKKAITALNETLSFVA